MNKQLNLGDLYKAKQGYIDNTSLTRDWFNHAACNKDGRTMFFSEGDQIAQVSINAIYLLVKIMNNTTSMHIKYNNFVFMTQKYKNPNKNYFILLPQKYFEEFFVKIS